MRPERCLSWCLYNQQGECQFCGWPREREIEPMTGKLRIYDISTDDWRDATQLDIDMLGAVSHTYGVLRATVEQQHAALQERIKLMKSKAGAPQ
jgi:hypothetical protein